jgi:hypothetical protein
MSKKKKSIKAIRNKLWKKFVDMPDLAKFQLMWSIEATYDDFRDDLFDIRSKWGNYKVLEKEMDSLCKKR